MILKARTQCRTTLTLNIILDFLDYRRFISATKDDLIILIEMCDASLDFEIIL